MPVKNARDGGNAKGQAKHIPRAIMDGVAQLVRVRGVTGVQVRVLPPSISKLNERIKHD